MNKKGRKLLFDDRGSKMSEDEGSGTSTTSRASSTRTEKDGIDAGGGDSSLVLDFAGFRRDRHGAVKKKQIEIVKGHR